MIGFLTSRNHSRLRGLLSAYIDGEVSESEASRVAQHLAGCERCRAELDTLRMTVGLLRELPLLAVPRSFTLTEEPATIRSSRPVLWAAPVATSVAALLLVALLVSDLSGVVTQSTVLSEEAAIAQLEAAPVAALPLPAAAAAPAPAPAGLTTPSPGPTPAPPVALAAAPAASPASPASSASEEETTAAGKIVEVEAESEVAAAEVAIETFPADTDEEMETEGIEQRSVGSEEEVPAGVEVMADQPMAEPQVAEAAEPFVTKEPVQTPAVERLRPDLDELGGISAPLWQLEIALGGLFVGLALVTLWMLKRRNWPSG